MRTTCRLAVMMVAAMVLLALSVPVHASELDGRIESTAQKSPVSKTDLQANVTLRWDKSIDDPYLSSYKIYYSTTSGPPYAPTSDYVQEYSLDGGTTWNHVDQNAPYPITVNKGVTRITLKILDKRTIYYFALTAVDSRGLESKFSNEVPTTNLFPEINVVNK